MAVSKYIVIQMNQEELIKIFTMISIQIEKKTFVCMAYTKVFQRC